MRTLALIIRLISPRVLLMPLLLSDRYALPVQSQQALPASASRRHDDILLPLFHVLRVTVRASALSPLLPENLHNQPLATRSAESALHSRLTVSGVKSGSGS